MQNRLNYFAAAPETMQTMVALETFLRDCGLEKSLIHLVKLRASQINGCSYCVHMHNREARAAGEDQTRLDLLCVWRESPLYSDRERAALAWAEAVTLIAETGAPESDCAPLGGHFTDAEIVNLTMIIGAINVWNRIAIGFRAVHPTHTGPALAANAAQQNEATGS